jgi:glycogen synthase
MSTWQDKAIVAVVSRLTPQKGVHLIKHAAYKVRYTLLLLLPVCEC